MELTLPNSYGLFPVRVQVSNDARMLFSFNARMLEEGVFAHLTQSVTTDGKYRGVYHMRPNVLVDGADLHAEFDRRYSLPAACVSHKPDVFAQFDMSGSKG